MTIRVIAVEDHPLMLKAIVDVLSSDPEIQVVGELNHSLELARMVREKNPDVLVLDLSFNGEAFEPVTTVRNLTQSNPNLHILILTGFGDSLLMHTLIEAGALGYIFKSDDLSLQLPKAVKMIYKGQPFYSDQVMHKLFTVTLSHELNDQELSTLRLVAEGRTNDDIATAMKVSDKRVRNILTSLYDKMGVSGEKNVNQRVACLNRARELGLLNGS